MEIIDIEVPQKQIKISKTAVIKENIVWYGIDNEYPTTMFNLINSSQTAKACVDAVSKFINTEFVDEANVDVVVGMSRTMKKFTLSVLVEQIARSLALYNGAYILVARNKEGQTIQVRTLNFADVRLSEFDSFGTSVKGIVYDWAQTIQGKKNNQKNYREYPIFVSSKEVNRKLCEQSANEISFQIYYIFLNDEYFYPENSFETVAYDMAAEKEIQVNRYNEITQGTPAKLIIRTDIPSDEVEKKKLFDRIQKFAGSTGDRVLLIQSSFDENGVPISNGYSLDTINDTRDLSKFSEAEKDCANNIRKVWNIPAILVDFEQATGISVSGEQLKSAVDYFDQIIEPVRRVVSDSLAEIFESTTIDFNSKNFELQNKTIRTNGNDINI